MKPTNAGHDTDEERDNQIKKVLEDSQSVIQQLQGALDYYRDINARQGVQLETWLRVSESDNTMEMSSVAKVLNYKGIGRNKMFKILRDIQILRHNNEPYQKYIDSDYFEIIEQEVTTDYGTMVNRKTVVTQKGLDYIRKKLDEEGYESASR